MKQRKLIIVGAGGLGLEACWVAKAMATNGEPDWDVLGFADDNEGKVGTTHYGVPVLCTSNDIQRVAGDDVYVHLAIGGNYERKTAAKSCETRGLALATLVHPRSERGQGVVLGEGCYVGAFATLAPHCTVGNHVIVNINAVVGHEVTVGDFAQIAPGAVLTGGCAVGVGGFIGVNAAIFPRRRIGDFSTVANNSFVIADVPSGATVMGVPAKVVYQR